MPAAANRNWPPGPIAAPGCPALGHGSFRCTEGIQEKKDPGARSGSWREMVARHRSIETSHWSRARTLAHRRVLPHRRESAIAVLGILQRNEHSYLDAN